MPTSVITASTIVVATEDQVSCPVADEVAILNLEEGVYYGLNPVGTRIWGLLQEPCTVAAIHATLLAEFDVDPARCEQDLLALLNELALHRLIEVRDAPAE
ncbi:MAG: PqqD family protein [Gemmatimonadetes bacterium]|nr:PqqD family protein [Gemmatimonadota bacterium]